MEEKAKFDGIFESLLPVNGLLSGDKVKPVLMNSKLPLDVLGRVSGSLTPCGAPEFRQPQACSARTHMRLYTRPGALQEPMWMENLLQPGWLRASPAWGTMLVWTHCTRGEAASEVILLPKAQRRAEVRFEPKPGIPPSLCFWGEVWECLSIILFYLKLLFFYLRT